MIDENVVIDGIVQVFDYMSVSFTNYRNLLCGQRQLLQGQCIGSAIIYIRFSVFYVTKYLGFKNVLKNVDTLKVSYRQNCPYQL